MIKNIILICLFIIITACASVTDKMGMPERKTCTEQKTTLAEIFCKNEK